MKKKLFRGSTFFTVLCMLFMINFSMSSCEKDGPAKAIITISGADGLPIEGASVTLHQDTIKSPVTGMKANVSDVQISDADGKCQFEFPLEAILNIDVIKDKKRASDYIRLEKAKTVVKTVVLK